MSNLHDILQTYVSNGSVPGVVGLMARGDRVEVAAAGSADVDGTSPMARDSIFRVASITKPITAAAVMMLVEDGRIALEDPVKEWLPELASPAVVRTPASPLDDVVPAVRPITVADLLTFRAGYGFPSDFSLPAVRLLVSELKQGPPQPQLVVAPDEWMAALARIPLLRQPGQAWLYNTCSDILGVLIARVSGRPLPEFLAERLFEPLGMADTGFEVPAGKLDRFTSYYRTGTAGGLDWLTPPAGSGAACRRFPPGRAAWSPPSMTGIASPGCCSSAGAPAAASCSQPRRCGR
jgi:CubicO group peptidase (beta-lactamase class C family)